jgi:hypothetical protein
MVRTQGILKRHSGTNIIFTPDASKAMALIGNTADVYGQTGTYPVTTID